MRCNTVLLGSTLFWLCKAPTCDLSQVHRCPKFSTLLRTARNMKSWSIWAETAPQDCKIIKEKIKEWKLKENFISSSENDEKFIHIMARNCRNCTPRNCKIWIWVSRLHFSTQNHSNLLIIGQMTSIWTRYYNNEKNHSQKVLFS